MIQLGKHSLQFLHLKTSIQTKLNKSSFFFREGVKFCRVTGQHKLRVSEGRILSRISGTTRWQATEER
jgi:hypothetical protein